MEKEEIILTFAVETQDAENKINELKKNIEGVKNTQDDLNQKFAEGTVTLEDYNKETAKNNNALRANEKAIQSLTSAVEDETESINGLRKQNSELTKERNALNLKTREGRDRLQEINKQIDENNKKIRENVSGLEKQKINIGNYASALDGIVPGLGGFINGIEGATTAGKAFIATPIGAVLAALAVALAAVINYFKTTGEGEDQLARATAALNAVFKILTNLLNEVVGYLLDADKGVKDLTKAFGPLGYSIAAATAPLRLLIAGLKQLGNLIPGSEAAQELADALDGAADAAGMLSLKQKEVRNEIDLLLLKAKEKGRTDEERAAFLEQALQKEIALNKEISDLKNENLRLGLEEIKQNNARAFNTVETAKKTSEEVARQLLAQGSITDAEREKILTLLGEIEEVRGRSIEVQQKIQNKQAAIDEAAAASLEKRKTAEEKQAELERQRLERETEIARLTERTAIDLLEKKSLAIQTEKELEKEKADYLLNLQNKLSKGIEERIKAEEKVKAQALAAEKARQAQLAGLRDQALGVAESIFGETKKGQTALTLISTYLAAQKAYESQFVPLADVTSPVRGTIAAALAVAQGLARVAAINGVGFSGGGYTGDGGKYEPAGIVHKGEVVFSQRDVAMLGGANRVNSMRPTFKGYADGGIVTSAATNPINQQFSVANAFRNMPPIYASWKEATEIQTRVRFKESLTTV